MNNTLSTKEIYNNIFWAIRCTMRTSGSEKLWWGRELKSYKEKYPQIFKAANESYWLTK